MRILKFSGIVLFAVLICAIFAACSSDNENSSLPEANYYLEFHLENSRILLPGETIHIKDDFRSLRFSIKDRNDEAESILKTRNLSVEFYGAIVGEFSYQYKNGEIELLNPGESELILTDIDTDETYIFNIVIDEIDVKENLKIGSIISKVFDINGNIKKEGPLLELITTDKGSESFYNSRRFTIHSFGSNKETCKPSFADEDWHTTNKLNSDGTLSGGFRCYLGKVSITDIEFWFYKFSYGSTTHEVRKYANSKECLWNGEWNN